MFKSLSSKLSNIFDKLKSRGRLSESEINEAMRDIRIALLEADVALPVVKDFIAEVSKKALGQEVVQSVSPGQMIVKIIHDELVNLLSQTQEESGLNLSAVPPVNIMVAGLQGAGKTTFSAKLARWVRSNNNKKVLLVSLDVYRPAAQEQLAILADKAEVSSLEIVQGEKPLEIAKRAMQHARLRGYDVVIYDTAGRTHIDVQMISEAKELKGLLNPSEVILVLDAMTGQDAVNIASTFQQELDITGLTLSRIDGDSRGGAALSAKYITSKPIKFLSSGESIDKLEMFDAERIASRILDMGDIVSFVEQAQMIATEEEAEKAAKKLQKGKFDLMDYLDYIQKIKKMGGVTSLLGMLPGAGKIMKQIGDSKLKEDMFHKQEAIISSMTKKERKKPDLLNASRRKRIAEGSGTNVQEVNKLMKQYMQISKMMKKVGKNPDMLSQGGIKGLFS